MGTPDPLETIILFDGICNLCNSSVQFIIKRDRKAKFRFAALQSDVACTLLTDLGESTNGVLLTIIAIRGKKVYHRSDAALEIARGLSGLWPLLYAFKIIPRPIRDLVYDWIAANRFKWFGKRDVCMVPTPELQSRFLH